MSLGNLYTKAIDANDILGSTSMNNAIDPLTDPFDVLGTLTSGDRDRSTIEIDKEEPIPSMIADSSPTAKANGYEGASILDPFTSLRLWVEHIAKSGIDEDQVRSIVNEQIAKVKPRKIEVKIGDKVTKLEGAQHYQFELVLKAIASGVNLALTGSTATSKTTMAIQCAKSLGKEYMLFRPMHSPSQAEGYMSATGEYIQSNLYRAHKGGMVAIFDEFDASDPSITLIINSLLDNKCFTYPNGETVCNPEFQVIATMNTHGTGSDRKFVGRNRLDAATLDRFAVLEIHRDLSLEASLIGVVEAPEKINLSKGGLPVAEEWLRLVREERARYAKTQPDKIVSMRAVRDGWKLMEAGIGAHWALKMTVEK